LIRRSRRLVPLLGVFGLIATAAPAQRVGISQSVRLGSDADDRIRLGLLRGYPDSLGYMLRSPSRLITDTGASWRIDLLTPELRFVSNSALPFSMNDGPMWAGRGSNVEVTAGVRAHAGPLRIIIAPSILSEQNREFQVIPFSQHIEPRRSIWANPFHPMPESIDLPLRFGDASRKRVVPGQSSISVTAKGGAFGFATENRWWGPGIRNAIVLGNNASGFPHLFLQAAKPVHTRFGVFDAQWIVGRLRESDFFDHDTTNDRQSVSALAMTWSPHGDRGFTLGATRLVIAPQDGHGISASAAFNVMGKVGRPNADTASAAPATGRDQVFSVFGRLELPAAGFEAYAEWARFEQPGSVRDFLEFPNHSQGYTLGLQWARPVLNSSTFRFQGEASYLEPSPSFRVRRVTSSYTSRVVPQGFTHLGQTLGAAIGPGASSQWLAGDVLNGQWTAGAFIGRIRWDNNVFYNDSIVPFFKREDISVLGGLRGSFTYRNVQATAEFTHAVRINYLFQGYIDDPVLATTTGVDIINNTIAIGVAVRR
jgi:hypothetical protein